MYGQTAQRTTPPWNYSIPPLFAIFDQCMYEPKHDSSDRDILGVSTAIAKFQTIQFKTDINSTVNSLWTWGSISMTASRSNDSHTKSISLEWIRLRSALERFRSSQCASKRFLSRNFEEAQILDVFKEVRADQEDAQADAEALEQELRDSLPIDVSRLSLEESRRSIKESKRVKLCKFQPYQARTKLGLAAF